MFDYKNTSIIGCYTTARVYRRHTHQKQNRSYFSPRKLKWMEFDAATGFSKLAGEEN